MIRPLRTISVVFAGTALAFALAAAPVLAEPKPQSGPVAPAAPVTAQDLFAKAQLDAAAGRNETAREELRRAAALEPTNIAVQKLLGDVEYRLQNYPAAEAAYRIVLAKEPNNKEVHNRLGGVYAAEDRLEDAASEFRKTLPSSEGFANLVQAYADEGRLGELEQENLYETEREPFEPHVRYNLAYVYWYEKKYTQAVQTLREALVRAPRYVDARNLLGNVYGDLGKFGEAIDQYKIAIGDDPKYYYAWMNWGVELIRIGDYRGGIEKIERAINLAPQFSLAYENLGVAYDFLGDFTKAVELYNKAITIDPRERTAYLNLGAIYRSHNLMNLAEAAYIKGLTVAPRFADLHYDLGEVYERQHKYQLALQQYQLALAAAPDHQLAKAGIAEVEKRLQSR